ncbi:hypothetical protein Tco_1035170 [Tanacetum coccineum]
MAFARSGACPLFFWRTGEYPLWMLSLCSAIDRGTPVMSDGCHANMSWFLRCALRSAHSSVRPQCSANTDFLIREIRVYSHLKFFGTIVGLFFYVFGRRRYGDTFPWREIVLRIVTIPPLTGNLIIPWVVDGTAWISLIPGLPIIPLYGDGDLTIKKFIHASVECSASPIVTKSLICPIGHIVSPLNPVSDVVAGAIWLWISGRSRLKQCSKSTSIEEPPSTYMRWTVCPPVSASMMRGPSAPSLSVSGGNTIFLMRSKLCVTFCRVTLCHDCIM